MTEQSDFECIISADLVRRALNGVSTEEARYYLNGVHVSPAPEGGAVITATDGHILITLHDPKGVVSGQGILALSKPMKAALKVTGIMLETRLLLARTTHGAGRAFVADVATRGDGDDYSPHAAASEIFDAPDKRVVSAQFGPVLIDGTFPDWRRVLPSKLRPDAPIPVLDQRLLARVAEALAANSKGSRLLVLTASGDTPEAEPVMVTTTQIGAPSALAVIMPVRHDRSQPAVPAWAQKPAPAIAA